MEVKAKNTNIILAAVQGVIAVFLIMVVKVISPVCAGMLETAAGKQVHMKCFYTSQMLVIFAIIILAVAVACAITGQKMACGIIGVVVSIAAFFVLNDSVGIGICANPDMACNLTAPFVKVCATLEAIISAVILYMGIKER